MEELQSLPATLYCPQALRSVSVWEVLRQAGVACRSLSLKSFQFGIHSVHTVPRTIFLCLLNSVSRFIITIKLQSMHFIFVWVTCSPENVEKNQWRMFKKLLNFPKIYWFFFQILPECFSWRQLHALSPIHSLCFSEKLTWGSFTWMHTQQHSPFDFYLPLGFGNHVPFLNSQSLRTMSDNVFSVIGQL